ncbi:glycine cleavage system regulatory protein [Nocardioides aromaticivorans]|uniref:Glycine cleavage system regulatory protein n=1 Tax=Nocardioides aromaticivorans TaxID=200618 RepID=A0A7Y9ZFM0_9ACTN|nr:ACT domain-containing protein [Nocardioides aromaticivorans]NYI43090.1 glycine cleavage system regulatory protein [Nocardioides aromaticivorans]
MATFTLTCIGDDRAGLVSDLSAPIHAHGASWNRSQMARLGGKFAGILLIDVPDAKADALAADLAALKDAGLVVTVERTDEPAAESAESAARWNLELLGADRPGIVAELSAALAREHVSIEELATDVREAPMAGGLLFEARAVLVAPPAASVEAVRAVLEAIADELMVEINLSDVPAA